MDMLKPAEVCREIFQEIWQETKLIKSTGTIKLISVTIFQLNPSMIKAQSKPKPQNFYSKIGFVGMDAILESGRHLSKRTKKLSN